MLHVVENIAVTQSHSRSFEFTPLSRAWVSSYWYSIVTMVISFDRKRDIVENDDFLSPSTEQSLGKTVPTIFAQDRSLAYKWC